MTRQPTYREEVRTLGVWCQENNLTQRQQNKGDDCGLQETAEHPPIHIDGTVVEKMHNREHRGGLYCYGNCSAHNRKALQRVVRSAQRITGGKLPALQDTYTTRCHRKAKKIKDNNHPSHCLFTPLSSRRRGQYRCIKAGTERLKNSFYCISRPSDC
ncbi:unnamed protein product [Oncorhynchus mykiss]|uniref:Uncharacterized protein n=1 Tax=Oncorhynchus mykiss TaxID=8022 RepID=A0A060YPY5_ONCMY|nr:unnamed protein product [Oncorhynchus mykiss]